MIQIIEIAALYQNAKACFSFNFTQSKGNAESESLNPEFAMEKSDEMLAF